MKINSSEQTLNPLEVQQAAFSLSKLLVLRELPTRFLPARFPKEWGRWHCRACLLGTGKSSLGNAYVCQTTEEKLEYKCVKWLNSCSETQTCRFYAYDKEIFCPQQFTLLKQVAKFDVWPVISCRNSAVLCIKNPLIWFTTGDEHWPLALDGAELVTLGEAECVELRLEVDGLGCV